MSERNYAFLDWTTLPNRASTPSAVGKHRVSLCLPWRDRVWRDADLRHFLGRLRGTRDDGSEIAPGDLADRARHAVGQRKAIDAIPDIQCGGRVLTGWLDDVAAEGGECDVAVCFESGGYFAIWLRAFGSEVDALSEGRLRTVALVLSHMVRTALDGNAAIVGAPTPRPDDAEFPYAITTTVVEPCPIKLDGSDLPVADEGDPRLTDPCRSAEHLLDRLPDLERRESLRFDGHAKAIIDSPNALVRLGARYGEVLDWNLPLFSNINEEVAPEKSKLGSE